MSTVYINVEFKLGPWDRQLWKTWHFKT